MPTLLPYSLKQGLWHARQAFFFLGLTKNTPAYLQQAHPADHKKQTETEKTALLTRIQKITANKKQHLDLLLPGDENETMIDRYLEKGDMYALFDGNLKSICVVTQEGNGKALIHHLFEIYASDGKVMIAGTGNTPGTTGFYTRCGFSYSHTVPHFFTQNYPDPIFEDGIQLVGMIYLKKNF